MSATGEIRVGQAAAARPSGPRRRLAGPLSGGSYVAAIAAIAALSLIYVAIVGTFGGFEHLGDQVAADWPWLVLILAGFGTQVALYAELRRRHRLAASVRATAGTGGTASAVGMVACCAHHAADLAPLLGASGLAVFLASYRVPIMMAGIAINAVGVTVAARRLHRTSVPSGPPTGR